MRSVSEFENCHSFWYDFSRGNWKSLNVSDYRPIAEFLQSFDQMYLITDMKLS